MLILAALPPAILVAGLIFLSLASTTVELRVQERRTHHRRAFHRAQSALAIAHARIKSSAYDAGGNIALRNAIELGPDMGVLTANGTAVHEFDVGEVSEVWIAEVADGLFQLDAMARVGNTTAQVRSLVHERDSFARYTLFINAATVNLAGAATDGWIHTNRDVRFFYGGHTYPTVTARDGFSYLRGATEANTTMSADSNPYVAEIPMPDLGDIRNRSVHDDGALTDLLGGAPVSDYRVHVELMGDSYELTAYNKLDSTVQSSGPLPLPATGVLYVDGDIAGIQGTLNGRLTVAATGTVSITDSIQYVDSDGNTAYINGIPSRTSDPFEPNPDYDGNSALGVLAGGDVLYSDSAPTQLEVDGYFFSKGKFGVPDSSFQPRSTLRTLGGHSVEAGVIGAYTNRNGTVTAGFRDRDYTFDARMANNPPPHFLAIDEARFGAFRLVHLASIGSAEPDRFATQHVPLGKEERIKKEKKKGKK